MSKLTKEYINKIADELVTLRERKNNSKEDMKAYKKHQNFCADKLSILVDFKTNKYKQFSNYQDLRQDGFEALMCSFETYKPDKGDFIWWASKYIGTRVSRTANAHSTIRIPLKKVKHFKPHKISTLPAIIDNNSNTFDKFEKEEFNSIIKKAIDKLPQKHKKAVLAYYDFTNCKGGTISGVSKELKISRKLCAELLNNAQNILKKELRNLI